MLEGPFIECGLLNRCADAKIDYPHVSWPSSDIQAVDPWADNISVCTPVGIRVCEHVCSDVRRDVKRSAFDISHKCYSRVPWKAGCLSNIDPCGKIGIDGAD